MKPGLANNVICRVCGVKLSLKNLDKHLSLVHNSTATDAAQSLRCGKCNFVGTTLLGLYRHQRSHRNVQVRVVRTSPWNLMREPPSPVRDAVLSMLFKGHRGPQAPSSPLVAEVPVDSPPSTTEEAPPSSSLPSPEYEVPSPSKLTSPTTLPSTVAEVPTVSTLPSPDYEVPRPCTLRPPTTPGTFASGDTDPPAKKYDRNFVFDISNVNFGNKVSKDVVTQTEMFLFEVPRLWKVSANGNLLYRI